MIVLIGAVAGLIVLALGLSGITEFMIMPVLVGAGLTALFFYLRSNRLSALKQFEDAG